MSNYFSYLPNFDYVNRIPGEQNISSYTQVKNLFKKIKLNSELFQSTVNFTKYTIKGNDRPDVVAQKFYDDAKLDWIVLLSNNIINIQDEWPVDNNTFNNLMIRKYGEQGFNNPHHYETIEIKSFDKNFTILEKGLTVSPDFSISSYDAASGRQTVITNTNRMVSNVEYETKIQDDKRNIFLLKKHLLPIAIGDINKMLNYRDGSTQYVNNTLVRGDNINLY